MSSLHGGIHSSATLVDLKPMLHRRAREQKRIRESINYRPYYNVANGVRKYVCSDYSKQQ
jgi:hypothetical protein